MFLRRPDLQLCEGHIPMRRVPVVPGHQVVGRVEAVGAGVTDPLEEANTALDRLRRGEVRGAAVLVG
jgi:D-arabinose 1-dehydrogenase-like Zn-dependent alcohol dehydrogenase